MRKWQLSCALILGAILAFGLVEQALGATTVIDLPSTGYLAATKKLDFSSMATGTIVSGLSDGTNEVLFDTTLTVAFVPSGGWMTWSAPPYSEEASPAVLKTGLTDTLDMRLGRPVSEFGFELEPNSGVETVTVTFRVWMGGAVVSTITKTLNWASGARLCAIISDVPFSRVQVISTATDGFAVAQLRYALPTAVSKPKVSPTSPRRNARARFWAYVYPVQAAGVGGASLYLRHRESKRVRARVHGTTRWVTVRYWRLRKTVDMSVNPSTGKLSVSTTLSRSGLWQARVKYKGTAGYRPKISQDKVFRVR